jgi:hypothetical protein
MVGGFEIASMQVNFSAIPLKDAKRSMRLFAQEIIPLRSRTSRPMKSASRSREREVTRISASSVA